MCEQHHLNAFNPILRPIHIERKFSLMFVIYSLVFLPPANEVCEGCFYTCLSVHRKGGLHKGGGWADPQNQILRDTVNERVVRILLECILVCWFFKLFRFRSQFRSLGLNGALNGKE